MANRRGLWALAGVAVLAAGAAAWLTVERAPRQRPGAALPVSRAVDARQALFAAIQPVQVTNCELRRFGEANDGGYVLCANLLGAVNAGYSYGISGYDGWGCEVSRRLHVTVHQYDCFNLTEPQCPGGSTVFHGECVGTERATQDGRPFDTLAGQIERNGDAGRPLVMKMDVEGAEWDSFLFAPDSVFAHIDQLVVEFHQVDDPKFVVTMRRLKTFFDIAHVHYNNFSCDPTVAPFPSWAFEALLVSKRLGHTSGAPADASAATFDAPNNPQAADCQAPAPAQGRS